MKRLFLLASICIATPAVGQSLDPLSYVNTPVGMQFLLGAYAYSDGNVLFDASLPLTDASLTVQGGLLAYAQALDLWGLSGKASVGTGYLCIDGQALLDGMPRSRNDCGLSDPLAQLSVNFIGGPALRLPAFAKYKQDLLVGASLRMTAPLGQYDPTKLINLGTNRWSFKPEVGASKSVGRATFELLASATFYTTNTDFFNGQEQSQAPLYAGQLNVIYTFKSGIWGALGGTLYGGGRLTVDGVESSSRQQNSRLGLTLVFPITRHNSLKAYASTGVSTRTGSDFDTFGIGWQYRWGGGM